MKCALATRWSLRWARMKCRKLLMAWLNCLWLCSVWALAYAVRASSRLGRCDRLLRACLEWGWFSSSSKRHFCARAESCFWLVVASR